MSDSSEQEEKALKEKEVLAQSKLLRAQAYAAVAKGTVSPSKMAIVDAYPGIKTSFLSGLFNKAANERLEAEFEARDKKEYEATGTTAALKISHDPDLQESDRFHMGVQKTRPKMTP